MAKSDIYFNGHFPGAHVLASPLQFFPSLCLQCFDILTLFIIGWTAGTASGLQNRDEVLAWLSVWSEVQMICIWSSWCHCHPIIFCCSKIQNGLPFRCWLTQVVLEKRPLNAVKSSSSSSRRKPLGISGTVVYGPHVLSVTQTNSVKALKGSNDSIQRKLSTSTVLGPPTNCQGKRCQTALMPCLHRQSLMIVKTKL